MSMSPRLLRPRATGFNPKSISGLAAWYDAADSTTLTIATGVSQWNDKSGNGRNLSQSTGNNQPASGTRTIGGKNALDFDGSNDGLASGFSLDLAASKAFTVFVVAATDTTSASYQPMVNAERTNSTDYTSGFAVARRTVRPEVAIGDGRVSDVPSGAGTLIRRFDDDTTAACVYAATASASGNSTAMWKNGTSQTLTTWYGTISPSSFLSTGSGSHRLIVGAGSSSANDSLGEFFNGMIGEVLVYTVALQDSQLSAISRYLGKKWGITVA
jgi:hypothetical protein